eukprot:TRINITY_DN8435_c0_g1_i1.p3 TRINITY_DN8435_c0_g1~~TRINITY_DN8435_c0_g1_i1.p3  ORF type:complete len:179 (+),score=8.60 TRINITY_DN8435_c0_g1_i1:1855-2391(+)
MRKQKKERSIQIIEKQTFYFYKNRVQYQRKNKTEVHSFTMGNRREPLKTMEKMMGAIHENKKISGWQVADAEQRKRINQPICNERNRANGNEEQCIKSSHLFIEAWQNALYADRAVNCCCNHCDFGGIVAAGAKSGKGKGAGDFLSRQLQTALCDLGGVFHGVCGAADAEHSERGLDG